MRVIVTLLFSMAVASGFCQDWYYTDCSVIPFSSCFSPVWLDTIDPVTDPDLFMVDTSDSANVWVYTSSHKTYFDSISTFAGWITDSIAPYGTNLTSKLEVAIPMLDTWFPTWVMFEHKYDITTGLDGGYLEYSCNRTDWQIVDGAYDPPPENQDYYQYLNLPWGPSPMLHDTVPAFFGTSSEWMWSGFHFTWFYPVMQGDQSEKTNSCIDLGDTVWVRFVFESDDLVEEKAGWMIRSLVIGGSTVIGSIDEYTESPIDLYPNPTNSTVRFELPSDMDQPKEIRVYDMTGRLIHSSSYQATLDVSSFSSGNYLVAITVEDRTYRQLLVVE